MEINNKNTVSAAGNQQKSSFLSALNAKRKKIMASISVAMFMWMMSSVAAFADGTGGGGGDAEATFNEVINFFADWIGRIGLIVAFVGAVMFGLAIKNDDADAKTRGLMTMASGFVVYAVTFVLDKFLM